MKKSSGLLLFFLLMALAFAPTMVQAESSNKWVRVVNQRSEYPIWKVYISSIDSNGWGPDQLKGNVIGAGESHTWTIPWRGCWVDLKVETFTGLQVTERVNACGGFVWTIYDNNDN